MVVVKDYYTDGHVKTIKYMKNGQWHNEDGPAYIEYFNNGVVRVKRYCLHDKMHRDGEPANFYYNMRGKLLMKEYFSNGIIHRNSLDGPAMIIYSITDGIIFRELYHENGNLHRENGPASIEYQEDNIIEKYYINGKQLDEFQSLVLISSMRTGE
jgi:antitoxin component YwqK of YwqJK toxin-antitoxin module